MAEATPQAEAAQKIDALFPTMKPEAQQQPEGTYDITRAKTARALGGQADLDDPRIDQVLREEGKENIARDTKPTAQPEPTKPAAPAEYEAPDFSDMDGVQLDQGRFDAFTPVAKELNLSQDAVAKLVRWDAQRQVEQSQQLDVMRAKWADESTAKFAEADIRAASGLIRGHDDFASLLEQTGLGNHPAMVGFLVALAKGH